MGLGYSIIQFLIEILGVIFAIRICLFKKDAWYFYLLATIIGSFQFFSFSPFDIYGYISNLVIYAHDLVLPLVAILVYTRLTIQPQSITKYNILKATIITIVIAILKLVFDYLTLPASIFSSDSTMVNIVTTISIFFGVLVYVGTWLLAFGYIIGLLINAIFSLQFIVMNISMMIYVGSYPIYSFITIIFNTVSFIIFLKGYIYNLKKINN